MKEISLNILDIANNCIEAGATEMEIILSETAESLEIMISDNGCGIEKEKADLIFLSGYSEKGEGRGKGLYLYKKAAEKTGGELKILGFKKPTVIWAAFMKKSKDALPLGDIVSTVLSIINAAPNICFRFLHEMPSGSVRLDSSGFLNYPNEIVRFCAIKKFLNAEYENITSEKIKQR